MAGAQGVGRAAATGARPGKRPRGPEPEREPEEVTAGAGRSGGVGRRGPGPHVVARPPTARPPSARRAWECEEEGSPVLCGLGREHPCAGGGWMGRRRARRAGEAASCAAALKPLGLCVFVPRRAAPAPPVSIYALLARQACSVTEGT